MFKSIRPPAYFVHFLAIFTAISNVQAVSPSQQTPGIVFPEENEVLWRTLSSAIHLIGVSILAYCLARRSDKISARGLTSIPIARWLVILIFIDSWLFLFAAGLLISGVGLSFNLHACEAGIFLCIVLYAISKILIYWFLVEKVHVVHPHPSHSRCKSPAYRMCMLFVIGYGIIIVIAVNSRIAFIQDGLQGGAGTIPTDGACIIGLGRAGSMSVLVYDLLLNVFFTCMFLYPLYKSKSKSNRLSPRLKAIAKRTLIAATVALITSAINMCILTVLHGQELGWICLASCGADVAINAVAIYSVTAAIDDNAPEPHEPSEKGYLTSNRGILESNRHVLPSTTRSVHFSPDTTRQSRGSTLKESRGGGNSQTNSVVTAVESISPPLNPTQESDRAGDRSAGTYDQPGTSGHREPRRKEQRNRPSIVTAPALDYPPPDPSEETSVEIRHEAPVKRSSRRASIASLTSSTTSGKRSKSVETSEGRHSTTVVSLSHAPSTLEEARDRIRVLGALTEIAGEKSKSQTDPSLLEVSVVTQTDRRIELRKKPPRNDAFDDYNSRRYDRRGNSFSSSGGL